jgi:hypothetical protein
MQESRTHGGVEMIDSVERKSLSQADSPEFPRDLANYSAGELEVRLSRLMSRIIRRIESRLPGRIRKLSVYAVENAVVLSGCCSTYYTKQVAQHTAMGVLEYERLINNIDVNSPK